MSEFKMNFLKHPRIQERFQNSQRFVRKNKLWIISGSIALVIGLTSCVSVDHVVMMPSTIKGADFVGMAECTDCHEQLVERFEWASHSRLVSSDTTMHLGCEACHGPGSVHSESGGVIRTILNPENSPETCFQCHQDTKASFALPHAHSVMDGQMSCSACHDPHEGSAIKGGGMNLLTSAQSCTECHRAQSNHYVFRHEATQDGCTVCHSPHGSVNDKMLKSSSATL